MFKNVFQRGVGPISLVLSRITIYNLSCIRSHPLQLWATQEGDTQKGACIGPIQDDVLKVQVYQLISRNLSKTFITCPPNPSLALGITLPHMILILKNLDKYLSFEVVIQDDRSITRRFRASNFQSKTRVDPEICTMPLRLDPGWNQVRLDLQDLTKRGYGTNFQSVSSISIHANCHLRRIYFSDRMALAEEELPAEFRLYYPVDSSSKF